MSSKNTTTNNSSSSKSGEEPAGFRVMIPTHVRPMIQSIRETTGRQHSDEEIYSVLHDCCMDPNETAQKLLYLDTFHEVKKKRDKKKEGQGIRGGRGNYYSNYTSSVAGGGRNAASRRENGVNHLTERSPSLQKTKNKAVPRETKASTTAASNDHSSLANGSFSHGHDRQLSVDGVVPEPENSTAVDAKKLGTEPLLPTPTFASIIKVEREKSSSRSNRLPTAATPSSVSVVYSSSSDPVLASPLPWNAGAVGAILREVGSHRKAAETNHIQGNKDVSDDIDKESSESEKTASNDSNSLQKKNIERESKAVENSQLSEPSQSSSLPTHDSSLAVHSSVNGSLPAQESVAPPKVANSGSVTVTIKANSQLLPESIVSDIQHVTFPNHFKVSEAVKNGLTFGSIDPSFGLAAKSVNGTSADISSLHASESSHGSDEIAGEPSPSSQSVPATTPGETLDHPQSSTLADEVPPPAVGNVSNDTELKHDESKQEMPLLPEGQQKPAVQSFPNYSYGFMLPSPGSQFMQMEALETQAHDASLISNYANGNSLAPSSSPAPSAQSSVAAPPQPVHLFRQPYPSFLSYGQYLSPYFMPQIHQFLSPNGLPQQPSTGNLYLSSAAAAAGVKFPLSQFKPGTNAGNPTHIGIAPGYGSYSSSPVGFNPITSGTSGKSTSIEDLAASQLKDNHTYTTRPLSEGSGVWIPAPGQDLSNMQINPLYNLTLQGQQIAFAAQTGHGAFPGIYHQPAQTVAAPSNANPLLQQSQAMPAAVETMGAPPSGAYQQPQLAQMNWNPNY